MSEADFSAGLREGLLMLPSALQVLAVGALCLGTLVSATQVMRLTARWIASHFDD